MDQALEALPSDYWRWWLLSNAPESADTDFTWDTFQNGVNKDLSDVLGNFVSRVTKFCVSKFGSQVPDGGTYSDQEMQLINILKSKLASYVVNMESIEIRKSAADLRSIWTAGNEYLQAAAPWSIFKEDPKRAACIIRFSLNLIALYSNISRPFLPDTANKIDQALNLENNVLWPNSIENFLSMLKPHHAFKVPNNLFEKLSDSQTNELKNKFSGLA